MRVGREKSSRVAKQAREERYFIDDGIKIEELCFKGFSLSEKRPVAASVDGL